MLLFVSQYLLIAYYLKSSMIYSLYFDGYSHMCEIEEKENKLKKIFIILDLVFYTVFGIVFIIDSISDFRETNESYIQYINDIPYALLAILVFITIRKLDRFLLNVKIDKERHNKWFLWVQFSGFTIISVVVILQMFLRFVLNIVNNEFLSAEDLTQEYINGV